MLLSVGQDGPGAALASGFGELIMIVVWIAATVIIVWNPGKRMQELDKRARALVLAAIAVLPVIGVVSAANHQTYTLRLWNDSGARIDNASVRFSGRDSSFGVLSADVFAAKSFQTLRPKGVAVVSWSSSSGQQHEAEIDLSDIVPRRYNNGVLTFTFQADGDVRAGFFIRKKIPSL